jgi:hypothetical protein
VDVLLHLPGTENRSEERTIFLRKQSKPPSPAVFLGLGLVMLLAGLVDLLIHGGLFLLFFLVGMVFFIAARLIAPYS